MPRFFRIYSSRKPTFGGTMSNTSRIFGWSMIAIMVVFLINTILTFWVGWTSSAPIFGWQSSGELGWQAFVQLGLYAVGIAWAVWLANRRSDRPLRVDAELLNGVNAFFIRFAFWVVLLVGMADFVMSFMRVEGLLEPYFGAEMADLLNRSKSRALYVHLPMIGLALLIAMFSRSLGFIWLALLVVIAELTIVYSRFIFSYEQPFQGDLVRFWYGALFLFASAYTLLEDGHVRVDVLYAGFRNETRARVNGLGAIFLGMTLCWCILLLGMWTRSSTIIGPILIFEITQSTFGLYVKYYMAGFLAVFAVSMMIQFVAQYFDALADRRGEPGGRKPSAEIVH